jgi:predicted transcriptional regulator
MTSKPYTVTAQDTVRIIIESFIAKQISGAPVVIRNSSQVISVVTEADLMKFAAMGGLDQPLADFKDKLVQSSQLVCVKPDEPFAEVFKRLLVQPVRRVLVVDDKMSLLGIVSRRDILKAFLANKKP